MADNAKRTIQQLSAEVSRDIQSWTDDLVHNLKTKTPIRSGNARRNWKKTLRPTDIGKKTTYELARNDVDYIERLDNGWSSQAPRGIVEAAVKQTRKKR